MADIQLEFGELEKACRLALESFPLLGLLRTRPEAYQALRFMQRAAKSRALDGEILASVRAALFEASVSG